MSEVGELPLLVLGLGLLVGGVVALLLARRSTGRAKQSRSDLDLQIEDLEAQRDELYARLRGSEGTALVAADRDELELAAARVLRELDALHEQRGAPAGPREPASAPAAAARGPAPATSWSARHPGLAGALLGGGGVALVALLVYWAQRDAVPAPEQPTPQVAPPAADGGFDRGEPALPSQVAAQVQALRERAATTPSDLEARRDLAQLLMAHEQFFDAFQEAQQILAQAPEDPVGNYVSGIVRYTMGQPEDALVLLERALAGDPALSQAALMRGLIQLQLDDREGAIATWEQGLAAIGGSHRVLEHVLGLAREGRSAEEIMSTPPPAA
jgi:tetratricopeptide (TPR) repeat protein